MKKRITCIALGMALIVSMSGCGVVSNVTDLLNALSSEEESTDPAETVSEKESSVDESEKETEEKETEEKESGEDASDEAVAEPDEPETEEVTQYHMYLETQYDAFYCNDTYVGNYAHDLVEFWEDDDNAASAAVDLLNQNLNEVCESMRQSVQNDVEEAWSSGMLSDSDRCSVEGKSVLGRADSQLLSLCQELYSYRPTAVHGSFTNYGYTVDVASGTLLNLDDVLKDQDAAITYLCNYVADNGEFTPFDGYEDTIRTALYSQEVAWYLDSEGIVFKFDPYMLTSFASGTVTLDIPYAGNETMFEQKYIPAKEPEIQVLQRDWLEGVGGEGYWIRDGLAMETPFNEDNYWENDLTYTFHLNGSRVTYTTYGYLVEVWTAEISGVQYLYLEIAMENDYHETKVLRCPEDALPAEVTTVESFSTEGISNTETDSILAFSRFDALGSFTGGAYYEIGSDGIPERTSSEYRLKGYGDDWWYNDIISTVELTLPVDGKKTTLPAGTSFTPVAAEPEHYLKTRLSDGRECIIEFEIEDGYLSKVNGMDAFDCFEMLYYAG